MMPMNIAMSVEPENVTTIANTCGTPQTTHTAYPEYSHGVLQLPAGGIAFSEDEVGCRASSPLTIARYAQYLDDRVNRPVAVRVDAFCVAHDAVGQWDSGDGVE